jgi:DNA-binding HxlR family transcriptional regulator
MRALFKDAYCSDYLASVELIGRRWTGAIIRALFCGTSRFTDIVSTIPGLSDRLLTVRLKELETEGIVRCEVPTGHVRAEYILTPKGKALARVLLELDAWSKTWHAKT